MGAQGTPARCNCAASSWQSCRANCASNAPFREKGSVPFNLTKVHTLERKVSVHERNIAQLADAMAELLATPAPPPKRPIGFITPEDKGKKPANSARRKT
jgi:hypothetical protein